MLYPVRLGYTMLTLAQTFFAINVITNKQLLKSVPVYVILSGRFLVSTLIISLAFKITQTPFIDPNHPQGKLTRTDLALVIVQAIFASFVFNALFNSGLQYTTATTAGIISSTLPAITALSAFLLLKENIGSTKIISIFLAMLGILTINIDAFGNTQFNQHLFGDVLIFLSMFPEAWFSIISRKLAGRVTPLGAALVINVVGILTIVPLALYTLPMEFNFSDFTLWQYSLMGLAGISGVMFFWGWGKGLSIIPASTAGIFGGVMPVVTTLLAILFLQETLAWYDIAGMLLVLLSIFIGAQQRGFLLRGPKPSMA